MRSTDGSTIAYTSLGHGEVIVVVGGALSTGSDYLAMASVLASRFRVVVVDRRGRGDSSPQGDDYSIEKEREDLDAVVDATGATRLFGHSYGGLCILETAKCRDRFTRIALYEPGVSVNGSIPTTWLEQYERLLNQGDSRGAFAVMVKNSGFAPPPASHLPLWYLRIVLRIAIRQERWQHLEPLLQTNLNEHRVVADLDSSVAGYAAITSRVRLLAGSKTPRSMLAGLDQLNSRLPNSSLQILPGLDHLAPSEKAAEEVAGQVLSFFD
ncbi:MAG: alpha/beta hydrolase [bacterium]|nr:alpha/beta hydrolase [bacterium]